MTQLDKQDTSKTKITASDLKAERLRLGLSLNDMAARLHLPAGSYAKYEYEQREIPDDMVWRLALTNQDPQALSALILEKTREFQWPRDLKKKVAQEIGRGLKK